MSDKRDEKSLLLDHNYDGIQELDHLLPRWWVWLFGVTIAFGAWYSFYYLTGTGPTQQQELAVAMREFQERNPKPAAGGSDEAYLAAEHNPEALKLGGAVFAGKCLVCHGDKGQGLIGPNLTDDFWIHGKGTLQDIANVVTTGVLDKGMPPWGAILKADELVSVVAFIHSLHGTNPAGAKPPQGDKVN